MATVQKPVYRFVVPELTRNPEQKAQYEKINESGVCPFCGIEELKKWHVNPILNENDSWLITQNDNPYRGTKLHLLFIIKEHIVSPLGMNEKQWLELHSLIKWAETEFHINSGGFFMRFGEPGHNGSSVEHLHAHIIVGSGEMSETAERVKVKLGYAKET